MKVLVIGSGGREHALVWKLRQSSRITQLYCAPGNGGISREAECVPVDQKSLESLVALANQLRPDLTVVGPELPLQIGIVDEFTRRGWPVFGPTRAAAQLETSKSFAKEFMLRHRIPTAHYAICNSMSEVKDALSRFGGSVVVKADGLAAGKGVVMCKNKDEAMTAAAEMLSGKMVGEAGARVVLEECLQGDELSFLVLSDGERVAPLVAAQDHKRVGDGDTGPNTGGMGAYSPAPVVTETVRARVLREVIQPTLDGLRQDGIAFTGFLYAGLMIDQSGAPRVLEFNCRLGDPETQPLMMRLASDLVDLAEAAVERRLDEARAEWDPRVALGVVMAAQGYPGSYRKKDEIHGLNGAAARDLKVFHAGTTLESSKVLTTGGRVLCVCALGADVAAAQKRAYEGVAKIRWEGVQYRKDIGYRAIGRR